MNEVDRQILARGNVQEMKDRIRAIFQNRRGAAFPNGVTIMQ